jgi:hypothetical protein
VARVAAVISVACGAILELGIYNDADKGSGSLEPFQGKTSMTAARRNLSRRKIPRSMNPGSS